jgi:hypothetical protein
MHEFTPIQVAIGKLLAEKKNPTAEEVAKAAGIDIEQAEIELLKNSIRPLRDIHFTAKIAAFDKLYNSLLNSAEVTLKKKREVKDLAQYTFEETVEATLGKEAFKIFNKYAI